jgi:hypothetical protein
MRVKGIMSVVALKPYAAIMAQAANLKGVALPVLLPGITLNTSATDYRPIKDGYMVEFRDSRFVVVSELLHGN